MAHDVGEWLEGLGLGEYAGKFVANGVDFRALPHLTENDLRELGVLLGHRWILLAAIDALQEKQSFQQPVEPPSETLLPGDAERRQLTVLFCDIVASTELSVALDPEELRDVIRRYQNTVSREVARFDGHVAKFMGDGVLVYFGYPVAHEDDAARGVRAGLAITEAIGAVQVPTQSERRNLAVRIGINTGLVVAGDIGSDEGREEMAIVGMTPNIAARLQGLAAPNTVLVGADTYRLTLDQFDFEDMGRKQLKGVAGPVATYRARGETDFVSRFEARAIGGLSPLVGRQMEMELLASRWQTTERGRGQVVLLTGEAGIGKSRIAQAHWERIRGEPHIHIRCQCSPFYSNAALYPFIRHISRAAHYERDDSDEQKLDKLEALLVNSTDKLKSDLPLIASLLSVAGGERYPLPKLSSDQQKHRTLVALADQLIGLSSRQNVLLVVEDVNWVDPTSVELLTLIISRVRNAPIFVLITFRPGFDPPWIGQPHITEMVIDRLDRDESHQLLEQVPGGAGLSENMKDRIVAKTDGVPLYVEELTRTVIAAHSSSGEVADMPEEFEPSLTLPASLQDSLMARLDQVGPAKGVAQIAAIVGREFPAELLAELYDGRKEDLDAALKVLLGTGLVFRRGEGGAGPYVFRHALIQDSAYESLLKADRRDLHARLGHILENRYAELAEMEPELLAHHFSLADLPEPALRYLALAGRRAFARSANTESVAHVTNGLAILKKLPESEDRARLELQFQIILGAASWSSSGFASEEVERAFLRARDLCDGVGTDEQLLDILRGLYGCYYARGNLARGWEQAEQVMAVARRTGAPGVSMLGHMLRGHMMFWRGEFPAARQELEAALELYDPVEQSTKLLSTQIDPRVNTLLHLCWTLWMLGYPDQALRRCNESLDAARTVGQPFTLALFWTCATFHCCGRRAETKRYTRELREVTTESNIAFLGTTASVLEGHAMIERQEYEAGLARITQAFQEFQAQSAGLGRPWAMSLPAVALGQVGKAEQGLALLAGAFATVEAQGERMWEAELHRLKGELLQSGAAPDETVAETSLRAAIKTAAGQGAKSLELRAAISLARLLRRRGDTDQAHSLLRDVHDWFEEGLDTADVLEAAELLGELV